MSVIDTLYPHELTVWTYNRFAPFSYERDGRIVGTDIALLEQFAHTVGLRARFETTEFPDIWKRPGESRCDVAAAGIAALDVRDPGPFGCWSEPYAIVRRSLLVRKSDVATLREPRDFAGRTIVVTAHSTADVDARTRYAGLTAEVVPELPTQDEMVRRLLAREVDAYAGGETSNRFVAASEPRVAVVDVHDMDEPETLHFVVRRHHPSLLETLNAFIRAQREVDVE